MKTVKLARPPRCLYTVWDMTTILHNTPSQQKLALNTGQEKTGSMPVQNSPSWSMATEPETAASCSSLPPAAALELRARQAAWQRRQDKSIRK